MTSKKYRPWDPDQAYVFPPAMRDWLEEDHLVYRLLDVVGSLDIRSISHSIHAKDARGARPYNPRMMLALLLYSYMNGIYSSRLIAAATYERIDFRVLTGDQHPFHTVINEFRLRHLDALPQLFVQVLQLCDRAGPLKLEHVSLDGSKVNANASQHKAKSHGRMVSEIKRLEKEARQAKAEDLRERAERQRKAAATEKNPTERKRKLTRASRSEENADRLTGDKGDEADNEGPDDPDDDLPAHRVPTTTDGAPTYKSQRNFTDPGSVFGHIKEPRGFRRFSLRGVFKVRAEWTLVCLCHNLIKLLAPQSDLAEA